MPVGPDDASPRRRLTKALEPWCKLLKWDTEAGSEHTLLGKQRPQACPPRVRHDLPLQQLVASARPSPTGAPAPRPQPRGGRPRPPGPGFGGLAGAPAQPTPAPPGVPNVEGLTCGPLTLDGAPQPLSPFPPGPSPASTASLTRALYPAEKTKDRGSNTIGARLNRVEDKVGARAPGRAGSGEGHGPRGAAVDSPSGVASCVRAALPPGLGSGPPYPGAHDHSPTRSRCRSPGPWFEGLWHVVSLLTRGTWCPEAPLGSS